MRVKLKAVVAGHRNRRLHPVVTYHRAVFPTLIGAFPIRIHIPFLTEVTKLLYILRVVTPPFHMIPPSVGMIIGYDEVHFFTGFQRPSSIFRIIEKIGAAGRRSRIGLTLAIRWYQVEDKTIQVKTSLLGPIDSTSNQLLMTRPAFGGNTIATIACPDNRPQMATVRPGVMQKIAPIAGAKAVIEEYNPGFTPNNKYVTIKEVVKAVSDTVDIMDAKILVSGGRGVGSAENFKILEDLAEVLGGTVSCSRAVVDNGWKPKDLQVLSMGPKRLVLTLAIRN